MEEKFVIDFYKWLGNQDYNSFVVSPTHALMFSPTSRFHFEQLPFVMQYSVLVDFFLEKTNVDVDKETVYYTKGWGKEKARIKAIKKAKEIYNKQ